MKAVIEKIKGVRLSVKLAVAWLVILEIGILIANPGLGVFIFILVATIASLIALLNYFFDMATRTSHRGPG